MNKKLLSAFLVAIISFSIFGISSAAAQAPAPASTVWSNTYGGKTGDAGFKAAQTDVRHTGAMRVPGYMSYLMWSFQNDGRCDAWVGPWAKVYTAGGKLDNQVTANWYFPTDMGQQATVTAMGLGWGKVKPQSATTFITPSVLNSNECYYVVSWAKVWDAYSGNFLPQLGPKVTYISTDASLK